MGIIREKVKKSKARKPDAKQRALAAEWEKMMARHSKPLDKGAKANGLKAKPKSKPKWAPVAEETLVAQVKALPKPITEHQVGTKPVTDKLADAKQALKGRVGVLYNKGGLHYLSDLELADQKTGAHRRRP